MDASLRAEINACIQELNSITKELDSVASDVKKTMTGMRTTAYVLKLGSIAGSYRKASQKLQKIK